MKHEKNKCLCEFIIKMRELKLDECNKVLQEFKHNWKNTSDAQSIQLRKFRRSTQSQFMVLRLINTQL